MEETVSPAMIERGAAPHAGARRPPASAMLLEDDPAAADLLVDALRSRDPSICIERAASLREFLDYRRHAEIDAYLIDLGLPDGDGVSAFEFLRGCNPDALALVVSSQSDHVSVMRALAAGAHGYLCKYDARCDIERGLQIAFDGGATVTPTIAARLIACAREEDGRGRDAPRGAGTPAFRLTARENEVLMLASKGYTFPQVAELTGTRISTVYTHVRHIYEKMSVSSISQALFEARQCGLL